MANTTRNPERILGKNGSTPKANRGKGERPEFDFSHLSWNQMKEMDQIKIKQQMANETSDSELMNEATAEMEAFICRVLVSLPSSWLVTDAPTSIDWKEPGMLGEYLQGIRFLSLIEAFNEAQEEQRKK